MREARPRRFRDRREAGRLLAARLEAWRGREGCVVLGLPRGGVVLAAEVARALDLPLDVLLSRKLRAPGNPELAIGAICEGGEANVFEEAPGTTPVDTGYLGREIAAQEAAIEERRRLFRGGRPLVLPDGADVIVVDDGIATGSTVLAAIRALRRRRTGRVVVATPVAPPRVARRLTGECDELVVLDTPEPFRAVGHFYEDFDQVSDDEVRALLAAEKRRSG